MDPNAVVQIVQSIGFPIVMCGAMGYYIKYTSDKHREQLDALNIQHDTEMQKITEALNNNTTAIQLLCAHFDKKGE